MTGSLEISATAQTFIAVGALGVCLLTVACGGSPAKPTPTPIVAAPVEPPLALGVECPTSMEILSPDGAPIPIEFATPPVSGSRVQGETAQCQPASGSAFPVGHTSVTCEARASGAVAASCSFTVTVKYRRLTRSTFLAFGDSVTEGYVPLRTFDPLSPDAEVDWIWRPASPGEPQSYPFQLSELLTNRYPGQRLVIENGGAGGERTNGGLRRLPGALSAVQPDVLLLLEGINDLIAHSATETISNIRSMASLAQSRNIAVVVATITPVSAPWATTVPGAQAKIDQINRGIAGVARDLQLGPPVDLFAMFSANPALLARDGKHPTEEGQRQIARAFFDAIVSRYEIVSDSTPEPTATRATSPAVRPTH